MPKHPKTPEARQAEVAQLTQQLRSVGLPDELTQPIVDAMQDFAGTGQGFSQTVKVPEAKVALVCLLSNQAHITSSIRITRLQQQQAGLKKPRG